MKTCLASPGTMPDWDKILTRASLAQWQTWQDAGLLEANYSTKSLRDAGHDPMIVYRGLKYAACYGVDYAAKVMMAAGVKVEEVAKTLAAHNLQVEEITKGLKADNLQVEEIAKGLKACVFQVEEIAKGLKACGFQMEEIDKGLKANGFQVEEIDKGLKATCGNFSCPQNYVAISAKSNFTAKSVWICCHQAFECLSHEKRTVTLSASQRAGDEGSVWDFNSKTISPGDTIHYEVTTLFTESKHDIMYAIKNSLHDDIVRQTKAHHGVQGVYKAKKSDDRLTFHFDNSYSKKTRKSVKVEYHIVYGPGAAPPDANCSVRNVE